MNERSSRATLRDVAAAASVSLSTASMALRGVGRLHPDTRNAVIAAARDLNYQVDANARRLRSGSIGSRMIATVFDQLPDFAKDDGFSPAVDGPAVRDATTSLPPGAPPAVVDHEPKAFWEHALYSMTYGLLRAGISNLLVPAVDIEFVTRLPVEAVLAIESDRTAQVIASMAAVGIPVVVAGAVAEPDGAAAVVTHDVAAAMAYALDQLVSRGSTMPGFFATPVPMSRAKPFTDGYESWCARHNQQSLCVLGAAEESIGMLLDAGADSFVLSVDDRLHEFDSITRVIQARGLRIPQDIQIIMIAESGETASFDAGVSTLSLRGSETGRLTATVLARGIDTGSFESIRVAAEFTARGSTRV